MGFLGRNESSLQNACIFFSLEHQHQYIAGSYCIKKINIFSLSKDSFYFPLHGHNLVFMCVHAHMCAHACGCREQKQALELWSWSDRLPGMVPERSTAQF